MRLGNIVKRILEAAPQTYFDIGHGKANGKFKGEKPIPTTSPEDIKEDTLMWFFVPSKGFLFVPAKPGLTHGQYGVGDEFPTGRIEKSGRGSIYFPPNWEHNYKSQANLIDNIERKFPGVEFYVFNSNGTTPATQYQMSIIAKNKKSLDKP
jgi:hypothetical protein